MSPDTIPNKITVERVIRQMLSDKSERQMIADAAGWSDVSSTSSRVLSGQQGILLNDLDRVINAAGLIVVSPRYLDWLAMGARIGANCWCERNNMGGSCGGFN